MVSETEDNKMKFYLKILTGIFFLISSNYLVAQPSVSFYFTTAFPVNEYQNFDNEVGYGGNLEFFFISPSKPKPIGIGASLSYFGQGLYFYNDPCDCETYIGNNRANNFINLNLILQVAPTGGTVRPYLETLFGGSYIYSSTDVITLNSTIINLYIDDWAWTYGVGGGLKFLINEVGEDGSGMFLDLKARYLMSSNVNLLNRNSLRFANNQFYDAVQEIQLNFVTAQIGISFYFR